jgi:hypothetical protein
MKRTDHLVNVLNERIILKWILVVYEGVVWIQLDRGSTEWWVLVNTIMNSDSIKGGEFIEQLSACQLLKMDSASWLETKCHIL